MSTEIRIPSLGMGMTEGTLTEWLAKDGQTVSAGEPIYALETEKSVQEIESPAAGVLKVAVEPGAVYEVGTLIATID